MKIMVQMLWYSAWLDVMMEVIPGIISSDITHKNTNDKISSFQLKKG